jgi:prepilin-type N-terminal cleavage/methylation domain-containing protein
MNRQLKSPHRPRSLGAGFTLTELVIALAVTGLLGAVGVSAYRTYIIRSQIAATVELSAPLKERVATAFRRTGVPPSDSGEAGLPMDAYRLLGPHVASVAIDDGRIEIRFAGLADRTTASQSLYLTPFETATREVLWVCGNAIPGPGLEPLGFAGGAGQAVQVVTTIDARYLPSSCR